jgi:hypothetical protein
MLEFIALGITKYSFVKQLLPTAAIPTVIYFVGFASAAGGAA